MQASVVSKLSPKSTRWVKVLLGLVKDMDKSLYCVGAVAYLVEDSLTSSLYFPDQGLVRFIFRAVVSYRIQNLTPEEIKKALKINVLLTFGKLLARAAAPLSSEST